MVKSDKALPYIIIFGLLTIILWNVPGGFFILYPFTILATWFHEMGHGIMALLMGGHFDRLVMFPDGSGYAQYGYLSLYLGRIGRGLIAAAGPVGPTLAGALLLRASAKPRYTVFALLGLSVSLLVSALIWVRPFFGFGFAVTIIFGLLAGFAVSRNNVRFSAIVLQFIGIQAFSSIYLGIGYFFSRGAVVGGEQHISDTEAIAQSLWLPYWFWGAAIVLFSLFVIWRSIRYTMNK